MIAVSIFRGNMAVTDATFQATIMFPVILGGAGLLSCLIALHISTHRKLGDNPSRDLDFSNWIASGLTVLIGFFSAYFIFKDVPLYDNFIIGWASPWISAVMGIISGVLIGIITEYYTSTAYKPTRK